MSLSKDDPLALRVAVVAVCLLLVVGAMVQLWLWYETPTFWFPPVLATLFLVSSYGLARLSSWARRLTVVVLWVLIFVLAVGVMNPFHASDMMAAGKDPPPVTTLLIFIIPGIAGILWCLHVLGKHKARFRSKRNAT